MQNATIKNNHIVYPDLSYKIIGALYDVSDELGHGHREKQYENAVAIALEEHGLKYCRQLYAPLNFGGKRIGSYYFDFLIEDKIVLE